jgi:phosphoribosyl 1,2-cyclic phosphodiesterase
MDIRILGAHNCESLTTSCVCFLVDGTLAIDAGALTSTLSIQEQQKIDAVVLTHEHYDHIRDIPGLALNLFRRGGSIRIYSTATVRDIIEDHLLNGKIYPEFQKIPVSKPTVSFNLITPFESQKINGHNILPIPVNHFGTTVGYQISDTSGKTIFYTADTGPELAACWSHISPQLLIVDVTLPNDFEEFARQTSHLTPNLLEQELICFRKYRGYLPRVIAVHMDTTHEPEIRRELAALGEKLAVTITVAQENMLLQI